MIPLPIEPYLIELVRAVGQRSMSVTVAGGLGIYLKRRWIQQQERSTLFMPLPDARATDDIDSFLALDVFLEDQVETFRAILTNLNYQATEKGKYLQFTKPVSNEGLESAKLDLHARLPHEAEAPRLKQRTTGKLIRLGCRNGKKWDTLNAWGTPEAFAIDHGIQELPLNGLDPTGVYYEGIVRIPHPFSSLCMKLAAARDYEHTPFAERRQEQRKHAFDVYLLIAMLDPNEFDQVEAYARQFTAHPQMSEIRSAVSSLFSEPSAPGCITLRQQFHGQQGDSADLPRFCGVLRELFAVPR